MTGPREPPGGRGDPSRRRVVAGLGSGLGAGLAGGLGGATAFAPAAAALRQVISLHIDDLAVGRGISPWIYGSSDIGTLERGAPSSEIDLLAGVTARRLGGNLMSTYNWTNNATNSGKDWKHDNNGYLCHSFGIPVVDWGRPAAVIDQMRANSVGMGAVSLLTLPLAGYVAADKAGPVAVAEAAPSRRFVPVRWTLGARASDRIDPTVADIPHLLARLIEQYGDAASGRGFFAYALDNEPGIWAETHPRIVPKAIGLGEFLRRSIEAATVIKSIDPTAKVFGPASWGVTEMVNFQNAADWPAYSHHGCFLSAYLAAFREASERAGVRLLDVLDVHWYAVHNRGDIYRSEDPLLASVVLDAPRALTEVGYREDSWVTRAVSGQAADGVTLPILPSLKGIIDKAFPGTDLAITEFNYGGAGQLVSGLALADVLGRFGGAGVYFASHWGTLGGWLGQAYRLYTAPDSQGEPFGATALPAVGALDATVRVHVARSVLHAERTQMIVINTSTDERVLDVTFASGRGAVLRDVLGFDAAHSRTMAMDEAALTVEGAQRLRIPARAARRFVFDLV